jgi:N-acetylmuramoyl-L-alanine amidase
LRKTKIPAVLAECGFLTNGYEGTLCLTAAHRQRLAEAIAGAIIASR